MIYEIKNEYLTVAVNDFGAELYSIRTTDTEYLWQGDEKYWSDRALTIFPYVARLFGGEYFLDGEKFRMDIHGFAPKSVFSAEKIGETKLIMSLSSNEETKKQYPRDFTFEAVYELVENTLKVTYRVKNEDRKTMYFGLGGHPGFNVPLADSLSFEDYELTFSEESTPKRVVFTPDCFVTGEFSDFELENGKTIPLSHSLFDNDAIVLSDMPKTVTLKSKKDERKVTVSYPDMKYLGIWHMPKTDAPYVCIEPWRSLPAADGETAVFEEQADLVSLPAGEVYENEWSITVE